MNLNNTHNTEIIRELPQKEPFLMVDELVDLQKGKLTAKLALREENIFVKDGVFHESGIMEHMAQSAGLRPTLEALQKGMEAPLGYFAAISNFNLYALPKVGSEIKTTITNKMMLKTALLVSAVSTCDDTVICESDMHFYIKNES